MKKNKLPWIIAMILVLAVSIPSVYAATASGSSLFFVLVNAAIVGTILFMLQSFLLPDKQKQEKTAIYVGIIVGSLLIGFLFGQSGYIWQGYFGKYFNFYVLVNAAIIATVIYIILGFKVDLQSPQGKGGYTLLIFIVSLIFAANIGPHWIWEINKVKEFVGYLLGPDGILNPSPPGYRLFVFIASFTVMAYFFVAYLQTNQKITTGGNFVTYAISLVLAVSMTRAGIGFPLVIKIAELVFFIVLADALNGMEMDGKYKWGLAFLIVGWSSAAVTAAFGPEYEGIIGSFMAPIMRYYGLIPTKTGASVGFGPILLSPPVLVGVAVLFAMDVVGKEDGWAKKIGEGGIIAYVLLLLFFGGTSLGLGSFGKMGMFILIPVVGIILLLFAIGRGEGRAGIFGEGISRAWIAALNKLRRYKTTAYIVGDFFKRRDPTLTGELQPALKELRLEIYTLMNFMLRHEIWAVKSKSMRNKFVDTFTAREGLLGNAVPTPQNIHSSMRSYIEGSNIREISESRWVLEDEALGVGLFNQYNKIYEIMGMLKGMLESDLTITPPSNPAQDIESFVNTMEENYIEVHKQHIKNIQSNYRTAVRRFRVVNLLRANRLYFLDMYNFYGEYVRGYCFAIKDAIPDVYEVEASDNGLQRDIDWTSATKVGTGTATDYEPGTNFLVEVNLFGYSVRDINEIQIEKRDSQTNGKYLIRRYKKKDTTYLHLESGRSPRFHQLLNLAHHDWEWGVEDMEKGTYHPYSKNIADYQIMGTVFGKDVVSYLRFSDAKFKHELTVEEIAFDREALKNPGKFTYWGRKNYYDETRDSLRLDPKNPYPTVSLVGLWQFINDVAKKRVKETQLAEHFLNNYLRMGYEDVERAKGEKK